MQTEGSRTLEEVERIAREIEAQCSNVDYLRLTSSDLHGKFRTKYVAKRNISSVLRNGSGIDVGLETKRGPRYETPEDPGYMCNNQLMPIPGTYRYLPWAGEAGRWRVGEVLCELRPGPLLAPIYTSPRSAAMRQVRRLHDEFGLRLYSSAELEFSVYDGPCPVYTLKDTFSALMGVQHEGLMLGLESALDKSGIDTDEVHVEYGPGQFELPLRPRYGIEAADVAVSFKNAVKEYFITQHLRATFMSLPVPGEPGNGFHFNHSLWDTDGRNALWLKDSEYMSREKADGAALRLSDTARHWIAGLQHHAAAMTAVLAPTANCYERLRAEFVPRLNRWALDDRSALIRVKNSSEAGTYFESRLGGAAANPYLVMTAHLAAGMDGLRRRLELEPAGVDRPLGAPSDLREAVRMLGEDEVLVEAMGQQLYERFKSVKVGFEMSQLDKVKNGTEAEKFEKYHQMYFDL